MPLAATPTALSTPGKAAAASRDLRAAVLIPRKLSGSLALALAPGAKPAEVAAAVAGARDWLCTSCRAVNYPLNRDGITLKLNCFKCGARKAC